MQSRYTAKKYQSLVISCLLHALILFLVLYTKMRQQAPEPFYQAQKKPAKVQFRTLPPQAPALPATPSTSPQQPAQTFQEPSESTPAEKAAPQSFPIHDTQNALPILKDELQPKTTHQVSTSEFLQAFKSALQAERQAMQPSDDTRRGPEHVQARMQQWGKFDYKQRIVKALRRASKFTSRRMNHTRSINTSATLTIPILKNGTLGNMSQYPLTGIFEVDRYLIEILQSTDFPPIPDRYATDRFVFQVPLNISIKQGSGTYYLSV